MGGQLALGHLAHGQGFDDFADGNFTQNPVWSGDDSLFRVNAEGQLQLDDPTPSTQTAYLATPVQLLPGQTNVWSFFAAFDGFDPSSSNNLRFYLLSSDRNLTDSLNGYFLQIGQTGRDDRVDLFRQDATAETRLIAGDSGTLAGGGPFRVEVRRSPAGRWEVRLDTGNTGALISQGSAQDNTYTTGAFTGLVCNYTSTRSDKFLFDNLRFPFPDNTPPEVTAVEALGPDSLQVSFSEAVTAGTALSAFGYKLSPGNFNFGGLAFADASQTTVLMQVAPSLPPNTPLTLEVSDIEDLAGNELDEANVSFRREAVLPGDVVLNEVLADPTPILGLPEGEFVELFNRLAVPVDLEGWQLADGSGEAALPGVELPAGGYLILCNRSDTEAYQAFGPTAGMSLPSLNNAGDDLRLRTPEGKPIDGLAYRLSWFVDGTKAQGGYSLERIDPTTDCGGPQNWRGSDNAQGGTPGRPNSVLDTTPDTRPPRLLEVIVERPDRLRLLFSETMDSLSLAQAGLALSPSLPIQSRSVRGPQFDTLELLLQDSLESGQVYQLRLDSVRDCPGNVARALTREVLFIESLPALPYDVLLHEIHPDPDARTDLPAVEFVELLNRSDKPIELQGWRLSDASSETEIETPFQLLPDSLVLLAPANDAPALEAFGPVLGLSGFPSLNNSGDALTLRNAAGRSMHFVAYEDDWYRNDFKAGGGFSLEMIDTAYPCRGAANWRASEARAGGTPGDTNSVARANPDFAPPQLERLSVATPDTLRLRFSETLDSTAALQTAEVLLSPASPAVAGFQLLGPAFREMIVALEGPLQQGLRYRLRVANLQDCAGNRRDTSRALALGRPEAVAEGDVRLNEILFNPFTGGADFVEIVNRSDKIIDAGRLTLATRDENFQIDDPERISEQGALLFPGDYLALTEDSFAAIAVYPAARQGRLLQMDDLPSLGNEAGRALLLDPLGQPLDEFAYRERYHLPLLPDVEGYSLERIHPDLATQDSTHWTSATTRSGGATPGSVNSVFRDTALVGAPLGFDSASVVLNEVLYDPPEDGTDFVELYNAGTRPIDLADFFLTRIDPTTGERIDEVLASRFSFSLAPEELVVLTEDTVALKSIYGLGPERGRLLQGDLFTLPASAPTRIALVSRSQRRMDAFTFADSLHLPLLGTANKGFSLERIHPDLPSDDPRTWSSAAIADGRATPAQTNSVLRLPDDTGTLQPIDQAPLRINEILYDPPSGGTDYVELVNAGESPIDLADYFIARLEPSTNEVLDAAPLVERSFFLEPQAYVALTDDPLLVEAYYTLRFPERLLPVEGFPNYPSSAGEGKAAIFSRNAVVVDSFRYREAFHLPLLNETKGVALERLETDAPTQSAENWTSASEQAGFGTPTYANSQQTGEAASGVDQAPFFLESQTFSPDGDGFEDNLIIRYQLERSDAVADVHIYNLNGQPIRTLERGYVLGREGFLRWDGVTDQGERAPIGLYIVYIELYGVQGLEAQYKLGCSLAGRL